jgi:diguanylate cyclase (GGDEF)-like protein
MASSTKLPTVPLPTLLDVIDESERIQDMVEGCAEDLAKVNEVARAHLATSRPASDLLTALQSSESVEAKVRAAAAELAQVNHALEGEVVERWALEEALEASRRRERAAVRAALHDPLTGLANRLLFDDRLAHALAQATRHGRMMSVMFIDLDGFKAINDTRGHEVGDQVLIAVAERLMGMTRAEDTVARLGGDEFLYLVSELSSVDAAVRIARKISDGVLTPVVIPGGDPVAVQCSLGVAIYPADAQTASELVQRADEAMYRAKHSGGGIAYGAAPPIQQTDIA